MADKRPKQIVFRPRNEYEQESLRMLEEVYPHMNGADRIGELLHQWRLRRDRNNTKDAKLDIIIHLLFEIAEHLEHRNGIQFDAMSQLKAMVFQEDGQ